MRKHFVNSGKPMKTARNFADAWNWQGRRKPVRDRRTRHTWGLKVCPSTVSIWGRSLIECGWEWECGCRKGISSLELLPHVWRRKGSERFQPFPIRCLLLSSLNKESRLSTRWPYVALVSILLAHYLVHPRLNNSRELAELSYPPNKRRIAHMKEQLNTNV